MKAREVFEYLLRRVEELRIDLSDHRIQLRDARMSNTGLLAEVQDLRAARDRLVAERDRAKQALGESIAREVNLQASATARDQQRDTACAALYQWSEKARDLLVDRSRGSRLPKAETEVCIKQLGDAMKLAWPYCDQIPF